MIILVFVTFDIESIKWARQLFCVRFFSRQKYKSDPLTLLSHFSSQKAFLFLLTQTKCSQNPLKIKKKMNFHLTYDYDFKSTIHLETYLENKWYKSSPNIKCRIFIIFFIIILGW